MYAYVLKGLTRDDRALAAFSIAIVPGSADAATHAPNVYTDAGSGGFVSYAHLGRMSPSFIRQAESGIAHLSSASRARAIAELPQSLRAQAQQIASSVTLNAMQSANIPLSANGCNKDVCIDIIGTGRVVSQWETTAYGNAGCIRADFWRNSELYTIFGPICSNGQEGVYYVNYAADALFNNGDRLCNTWNGIAGRACETIEG
jgi:hypothetical protein